MDDQLKANLTSSHSWLRLLFMILFAVLLQVASVVMWVVVILQFFWSLLTGNDNDQLRRFGHSLATYIYEALEFLTYNTDEKPFPFSDWPDLPPRAEEVADVEVVTPAGTDEDEIVSDTKEVVTEDQQVSERQQVQNDTKRGGSSAAE